MQCELEQRELVFTDQRPFASCHASSLIVLRNGDLLVTWFGGSVEGADDVAIWLSRRSEGGWSEPVKIADEESTPHWNPVLFESDNNIWLFYKSGRVIKNWWTMVRFSADEGHTWSEPKLLVEGDVGGRGPDKNKPIKMANGTWVAPNANEGLEWDAYVDLSYDGGTTWQCSDIVPLDREPTAPLIADGPLPPVPATSFQGKGIIQPTLWESRPGHLHMLLRSSMRFIYRSDSTDGGKTWCKAYPTEIPNNNSGIDLAKLDSGTLILACNPVGANWGARSPLALYASRNNGSTWERIFVLEDTPGEYSYPAVVSKGNDVWVSYSWRRENVCVCRLTVAD